MHQIMSTGDIIDRYLFVFGHGSYDYRIQEVYLMVHKKDHEYVDNCQWHLYDPHRRALK